jgi:hypothetical protein
MVAMVAAASSAAAGLQRGRGGASEGGSGTAVNTTGTDQVATPASVILTGTAAVSGFASGGGASGGCASGGGRSGGIDTGVAKLNSQALQQLQLQHKAQLQQLQQQQQLQLHQFTSPTECKAAPSQLHDQDPGFVPMLSAAALSPHLQQHPSDRLAVASQSSTLHLKEVEPSAVRQHPPPLGHIGSGGGGGEGEGGSLPIAVHDDARACMPPPPTQPLGAGGGGGGGVGGFAVIKEELVTLGARAQGVIAPNASAPTSNTPRVVPPVPHLQAAGPPALVAAGTDVVKMGDGLRPDVVETGDGLRPAVAPTLYPPINSVGDVSGGGGEGGGGGGSEGGGGGGGVAQLCSGVAVVGSSPGMMVVSSSLFNAHLTFALLVTAPLHSLPVVVRSNRFLLIECHNV